MAIRALVWGENIHEHKNAEVGRIYPDGMHNTIAAALREDAGIEADTATLQEPEHGLPEARLADDRRAPLVGARGAWRRRRRGGRARARTASGRGWG